ncbi:MAG: penicillin acylase family protein [Armatimonadota bacterium]|nr:penicillin acylase family protein [Armatimonadota bacterium]MDR7437784.1 penicillin acylase family protein [Armatimonadota bacterium]MDR7471292.1 penicillin acylase family protein [Armatimonadota bacterium]MDR7506901.1 penicillin acylase family protein [Armatimonadota bacterium]MDR7509328.1 penicillin acylase family protein [Armatimonadota bacterium]
MRRLVAALVILLLVALVAAAAAGVYTVRRAFPQDRGTLRVPGLRAPVEVVRDRWGIPHITAENAHDLFFAQGYVHAQDRLWQMELHRRTASGRLSELFGAVTLDTDRFLRTVGLRRAAQDELAIQDPETAAALDAYARGVNAFVETHRGRLPLEFALLRTAPEPWTPVDSLAFAKLMAWVLGGNWQAELLRAHLIARFGEDGARTLMPPYQADMPLIVPPDAVGAYRALDPAAVARLLAAAAVVPAVGSNNWAVAPSRTATGAPLLANDPHLEIAMPSVWYEMHLTGGGFNVVGATFPGVPGVVIGHNEEIAWGVTNAGPDVQDLYLERLDPSDPSRYLFRDAWEPVRVVREEIRVRGRPQPEVLLVRITRHGPLLNSVVEGLGAFVALRWMALQPGRIAGSVLRLDRARTWEEFRDALRWWSEPAQNFVYADRGGTIGYQLPGRIPVRARGRGMVPVPGWTGEYEWTGQIPFDRLPFVRNPARGYIVTANNRIVPETYPYFLAAEWDPGFRARRIEDLLAASGRATVDQMASIQQDVLSLPGQQTVRALRDVQVSDERARALLAELRRWDGALRPDSRAAAVYEAFRVSLLPVLFEDLLGRDLYRRYLDHADAWQVALLNLLAQPRSPWWGPAGRDAAIEQALLRAHDLLVSRLGPDAGRWTWGRLHRTVFVHPLGRVRALAWIFNAAAPPVGGDAFTVNNAGFDLSTFDQVVVASYRQVLDLADWDRSIAVHTTGQSGLPFHRHYRDFIPLWAAGRYHPLAFSPARIRQEEAARLRLVP